MTIDEARIEVIQNEGTVTIKGSGSLTFLNGTEFGDRIREASTTAENVVADLSQAEFIDTQILQDLGRAAVVLIGRGKRLRVLVDESAYTLRVLKLSGYETIMDLEIQKSAAEG